MKPRPANPDRHGLIGAYERLAARHADAEGDAVEVGPEKDRLLSESEGETLAHRHEYERVYGSAELAGRTRSALVKLAAVLLGMAALLLGIRWLVE
jgi:hypothetical protein